VRFERCKNFITELEREELAVWFLEYQDDKSVFKDGLSRGVRGYKLRSTTRNSREFEYPALVGKIFRRITEAYDVARWPKQDVSVGGVIAVVTRPGGDTYLHTDPRAQGSLDAVTFNILIQSADDGGVLRIGDPLVERPQEEKELHCYIASKHQHEVTQVSGSKNRYMLIFRVAMLPNVWE